MLYIAPNVSSNLTQDNILFDPLIVVLRLGDIFVRLMYVCKARDSRCIFLMWKSSFKRRKDKNSYPADVNQAIIVLIFLSL